MEITARSLWTAIHGLGFGALYLLACSGALMELYRLTASSTAAPLTTRHERFLNGYLIAMAALAWVAVLTGTYVIYPWYRAAPPPGTRLPTPPMSRSDRSIPSLSATVSMKHGISISTTA